MYKIIKEDVTKRKAVKLLILGDTEVGKTAIMRRFGNYEFSEMMMASIGSDKIETKFTLNNGKDMKIIVWDTAGGERFRSVALKLVRFIDGIILVFDVTSKKTFYNLSEWLESIKEEYSIKYFALFGNKADYDKDKWEVTNEEINKFAEDNRLKYFEVSAKTKKGINEGFRYIINDICEEREYIIIRPKK